MWTPCPCLFLQTPIGKATGFFPIISQFTEKSAGQLLGGWPFPFSGTILSTGQCDSVHDDLRPCGDPDSLQSKEALMGWSLVNVNSSYPSYDIFWGSNKFESVISSSSVPWISRVSICFHFWFQFHTPGEIYLLAFPGYIYGPRLWIKQQLASSQTFCTLSIVPAFSVGLRSCRTARGLLRRPSTDLHHCASGLHH